MPANPEAAVFRHGRCRHRPRRGAREDGLSLGGLSARGRLLPASALLLVVSLVLLAPAFADLPGPGSACARQPRAGSRPRSHFEVLSFAGHIVLFPASPAAAAGSRSACAPALQIDLAGHAATRLFATAGAGGIALTAWAMRRSGM